MKKRLIVFVLMFTLIVSVIPNIGVSDKLFNQASEIVVPSDDVDGGTVTPNGGDDDGIIEWVSIGDDNGIIPPSDGIVTPNGGDDDGIIEWVSIEGKILA